MDRRHFARLVRQALAHLYDQAYLQGHPLATALAARGNAVASGQTVHRLLLEAIGALRPPPRIPPTAAAWRSYQVLTLYYVEGRERGQVAEELGISLRQLSREQSKGVEAVTDLLWARRQELQRPPPPGAANELLDAELARLSAAPKEGSAALDATIRGVVATLSELAASRHLSLTVDLPPLLPPVPLERVVLRQVLLSVLSYAIESADGGGGVELIARPDGTQVQVSISHSGGSTPPRPARPPDERLAVATRLVEAHGGLLCLAAEGSAPIIHLSLPVHRATTVLVVDDNPELIQLFRRYLAGGRYHVAGATNGPEALQRAQELRPQAITLDVMMPAQDGWEILQTLKNLPATRDIPVIVCSVLRERSLALSLGAEEFLAKPVTQQALLAALARCLPPAAAAKASGTPADSA